MVRIDQAERTEQNNHIVPAGPVDLMESTHFLPSLSTIAKISKKKKTHGIDTSILNRYQIDLVSIFGSVRAPYYFVWDQKKKKHVFFF
jgi:hypothetical protein